jgi:hypothetical protein
MCLVQGVTSRRPWIRQSMSASSKGNVLHDLAVHPELDRCPAGHGVSRRNLIRPVVVPPFWAAQALLDEVTDEDRATWRASTPIDCANESFAITTSSALQYCVRTDTGC